MMVIQMIGKLLYLTTYEHDRQDLGGASWVDARVLDELRRNFDVSVFPIVNTLDETPVPLEVRGSFTALLKTAWQMLTQRQCYQEAKFKWSPAWNSKKSKLVDELNWFKPDVIVTSQWPALLMAVDAKLHGVLHIAHNVDSVLSELYDPTPLRVIGNFRRMAEREKELLQHCVEVLAISATDTERIRGWGLNANHLIIKPPSGMSRRSGRWAIGFIGKASWPPNKDAITNLVRTVMPAVREKMPSRAPSLVIAGRGSEHWDGNEGVRVLGAIDDVEDFYSQIDLVVVPRTSQTTGVSIKLLEAVEHGVTAISTRVMADDAGLTDGFISADTLDEIVQKVVDFYQHGGAAIAKMNEDNHENSHADSVCITDILSRIAR